MPDRVPTLASARRALGLSQRQVAQALGVHQRTISRLEHGELDGITSDLIDRYLAHLGRLGGLPVTPVRRTGQHSVGDGPPPPATRTLNWPPSVADRGSTSP